MSLLRQIRCLSRYAPNDQIFIHEQQRNLFKYTLNANPNSLAIGWAPSRIKVDPNTFQVNDEFLKTLNRQIATTIHEDFAFIVEAGTNANSFMPIWDFREVPRYARVPEVENIFGYVMVDANAQIVKGSYESNNLYRVCTGKGLLKLSDHLYEKMQEF